MPPAWNHNIHYHGLVLRSAPVDCRLALDVGCGRGLLARQIAKKATSAEVTGIDTDVNSLLAAMATPSERPRPSYVQGDVMTYDFSGKQFDFITAVATLHHLPLIPALSRFRRLLRPGGVLAIIGLYRADTIADFAWASAGLPASRILSLFHNYQDVGAPVQSPDQTVQQIQAASRQILPGAVFRRLLLFRYSLIWNKL